MSISIEQKINKLEKIICCRTTAPQPILYSQLIDKINTNSLISGRNYLITDYTTVHYIVDSDENQYVDSIITGVNEPLIVTATSSNTIDKVAKSPLYPQDTIYYDWNPANWLQDMSFSDLTDSNNPVIIAGFKGVIYFRHDTLLDNYTPYDFRNVKFRRWKADTATMTFNIATNYSAFDVVYYNSACWISLINNNSGNSPTSLGNEWDKILDLSTNEYVFSSSAQYGNLFVNALEYDDFLTFSPPPGGGNSYDVACLGNHFESFKDTYDIFDTIATILSNNVLFLTTGNEHDYTGNIFGSGSYGNTFRATNICNNNIFNGTFNLNIIDGTITGSTFGQQCSQNIICGSFLNSTIQAGATGNIFCDNFGTNNIGFGSLNNVFSNGFGNNNISDSCKYNVFGKVSGPNTIAGSFQYNIIGHDMANNTIGNNFNNNIIIENFRYNRVEDAFNSVGGVDFSGATFVYATYNCQLFIDDTSIQRLSYSSGGTPTTVLANF